MTDCCTPGPGFPNASLMQQMALNQPVVWQEICKIQQAILDASSNCQNGGAKMSVTVSGDTPMTFISGIESVTVNSGGNGYFIDSPSVRFVPPVGVIPSIIATGSVTTNGGNITGITITNGGLGYQPVPASMSVSSLTGFGAILKPLVNGAGEIVGVDIVNGGSGYTISDSVIATRAVLPNIAYENAIFSITSVSVSGQILSINIINPGSGYQDSVTELIIASTLNPQMYYPLGTGFAGTVLTNISGTITQVVINNTGAGYSLYAPYLVITDPGSGAKTNVVLTGQSVTSVGVLNRGTNYTTSATGTIFNPPTAQLPNPPVSSATVTINVSENTYGTNPNLYWQVWSGTVTDKQIQMQLNQVLSYFKGLGYSIQIQTNPSTGSTISWYLAW